VLKLHGAMGPGEVDQLVAAVKTRDAGMRQQPMLRHPALCGRADDVEHALEGLAACRRDERRAA